ncbi:unnamed protein product [Lasius platythorax]|uniref:C2H2-type domain-containing protein n=1 Tax=Lasius platythorax TaxID=488582 RepID=A0AAV2NEU9_9HYME
MARTGVTADAVRKESCQCFVCDAEVQGRFYALPNCRTQHSQARIMEKLGELVGERYMVVISEDDVICRSCALLINTLDRLETETRNIRDHVLRFLEQKYFLEDGELRGGGDKPKPCQPPQITKSNAKENTDYCGKQNDLATDMIDLETEVSKNGIYSEDSKIQKKSDSWLQCDKCKYTTPSNSFMMHHMRDHVKQRAFCDKCGLCISENQQDTRHSCTNKSENKENEKDNSDPIARNNSRKIVLLENSLPSTLPFTHTTPPPLIYLSSSDSYISTNILPVNDPTCSKQSMTVLQPVNMVDIDMSENMTSSESNPVQEMEIRIESTRHVFAFTDDGSVKLM